MLPTGWKCIGPATFARDDGWLVSVDDTDGAVLLSKPDETPVIVVRGSPAVAIEAVDREHPRAESAAA